MPEITVIKQVEVEVEAEFEAFCARCGAGICNNVSTRASRNRGYPQITIEPCERCEDRLRTEYDNKIERLHARIDELEKYEPA